MGTFDALDDPRYAFELLRRIDANDEIDAAEGKFSFGHVNGIVALGGEVEARMIGVEQSNSSIVFDDKLVLKVFRKLEPGINPELEMLQFLTGPAAREVFVQRGFKVE